MTPPRRVSILVVDDAAELRTLVRAMLAPEAWIEVVEAATGEDGVAIMANDPADLVIMDEQLPGISGAAATREIMLLVPHAEVVGFTASPEAEQVLLAAGATTHFSKLEFAAMIEYVIQRARRLPSAS
jgi:CheY-like chemotaxis protein